LGTKLQKKPQTAQIFTFFFVTLQEFAGFLYIKAMQRIEKFRVTIWRPFSIQCSAINCIKEHPMLSHQPFYDSPSGAKVNNSSERAKSILIFFF